MAQPNNRDRRLIIKQVRQLFIWPLWIVLLYRLSCNFIYCGFTWNRENLLGKLCFYYDCTNKADTYCVFYLLSCAVFVFVVSFCWMTISLKRNIRNSFIKILMPEWIDLSTLNTKSQGIKWTLELNIFDFTETARIWTKKMIK